MTRKAVLLLACCLFSSTALAQEPLGGRYDVILTTTDAPYYGLLELAQKGDALTGTYRGDPLEGTRRGDVLDFTAKNKEGEGNRVHLVIKGETLTGTETPFDGPGHNVRYLVARITAQPAHIAAATSAAPRRHEFAPTEFYRTFSAATKPVLIIAPGDTVHTKTVDAGGVDEKDVAHTLGGNPETGPFFVQGAMPGDTLAIHIVRLRLNRDYAISDDSLVRRGVNSSLAVIMKDTNKTVYWHLDRDKNIATPEKPGPHLATYSVPLKPMLGCVAVAPAARQAAPDTVDSGSYGGNMDFNEIVEGTTVYLQVRNPGALLYVGDGHAAMGDGELNGNGLETSMDVEFRVELISGAAIPSPRVESEKQIMALGYEGSLDEALRTATFNMQRWLTTDYKLDPSEASQVIGTAAQIRVSEAADRNAGVAVIIDKDRLNTLTK